MTDAPDISVVIVTWNTREMTLGCIGALKAGLGRLSAEVFVVDNGSSDGTAEAVAREFPDARVIANEYNLGFAAANNQAMRLARGRFVLLLNSDATVESNTLTALAGFLDANPKAGAAGAQLVSRDGKRENCASVFPSLATELLNKSLLRAFNPARYGAGRTQGDAPVEVESLVGACMMVRRETIDEVGMLDEGFFFFLEETDWCLRMREAGRGVWLVPAARAVHLKGKSKSGFRARAKAEYLRSLYRYFGKHRGAGARALLRGGKAARLFLSCAALGAANVLTLGCVEKLRARFATCAALLGWHIALCPRGYGLPGKRPDVGEGASDEDRLV